MLSEADEEKECMALSALDPEELTKLGYSKDFATNLIDIFFKGQLLQYIKNIDETIA